MITDPSDAAMHVATHAGETRADEALSTTPDGVATLRPMHRAAWTRLTN